MLEIESGKAFFKIVQNPLVSLEGVLITFACFKQTPGTRSMKALRSTYLESVIVQGSLLFRPKFKNFDKVYNVLVKYHSTTMWTRLRVTVNFA